MLARYALRRTPGERRLPCQHLVQHAPQRIHVAAPVEDRVPSSLLGTHVCRRPHRQPRRGELLSPRGRDRPRDPEIRNHRVPRLEQDVLRLDVPVHHVVAVGVAQGVGYFPRDLDGVV